MGKSERSFPLVMVFPRRWVAVSVSVSLIGVTVLMLIYHFPFIPGLVIGLIIGEVYIRHRSGGAGLIAALLATFVIAFGWRVTLPDRIGVLDAREQRLADRAGLHVLNAWSDQHGHHREVYFLRKSAAFRFKLAC